MTHNVYETSGYIILESNENDLPATCFANRPKPPGWRGDGGWTGGRKGRREEARQGGGKKTGSALRTKLKSRGCNMRYLKTILYSFRSLASKDFPSGYSERVCVRLQSDPDLRFFPIKRCLTNTPRRHRVADGQLSSPYPPSPSFSLFGAVSVML